MIGYICRPKTSSTLSPLTETDRIHPVAHRRAYCDRRLWQGIAAKAAFNDGVKSSMLKIITRSSLKFFRDFFIKKGFLDGKYGIIICTINAMSVFLKYSKIKELQEGKEI